MVWGDPANGGKQLDEETQKKSDNPRPQQNGLKTERKPFLEQPLHNLINQEMI